VSGYSDTVLATAGLTNFWTLGGPTADLRGSAPLTYGAATAVVPSRVLGDDGTAFDRTATSYVTANPPPLSGAHSVECLFWLAAGTISNAWAVWGARPASGGYQTELFIDPGSNTSMHIDMGNGSPPWYAGTIFGSNIARNTWHHVVVAVGANGSWEVILDGTSIGANASAWSVSGSPLLFDATHGLTIGHYGRNFDTSYGLIGRVSHLAVYNTKLDVVTAQSHIAALGPGPTYTYSMYLPAGLARAYVRTPTASAFEGLRHKTLPRTWQMLPFLPGAGAGVPTSKPRPESGQLWPR